MASLTDLQKLQDKLITALSNRLETDEVSAADMQAAISLLKHNSVTVDPGSDEKLNELQRKLQKVRQGNKLSEEEKDELNSNVVNIAERKAQ